MSHFAALPVPPSTPRATNRGVSAESARIDWSYADAFRHYYDSVQKQSDDNNRRRVFANLLDEHSALGWDGDEALPTSLNAVSRSFDFVANLPPRVASPDLSVNRYGDV